MLSNVSICWKSKRETKNIPGLEKEVPNVFIYLSSFIGGVGEGGRVLSCQSADQLKLWFLAASPLNAESWNWKYFGDFQKPFTQKFRYYIG